jgi:alpha-1,2-mannosyltransferase
MKIADRGAGSYYNTFMYFYANALRRADFLMANSTWTKNHVDTILTYHSDVFDTLGAAAETLFSPLLALGSLCLPTISAHMHRAPTHALKVYPACDTQALTRFALENRKQIVLSIAQFRFVHLISLSDSGCVLTTLTARPEKDHALQIRAFDTLLREHPEHRAHVRLVLGGMRHSADRARVDGLRTLAAELSVAVRVVLPALRVVRLGSPLLPQDSVSFIVNASYADVLSYLSCASIGLHTMVDEHFGINVVEFMARPRIVVFKESPCIPVSSPLVLSL